MQSNETFGISIRRYNTLHYPMTQAATGTSRSPRPSLRNLTAHPPLIFAPPQPCLLTSCHTRTNFQPTGPNSASSHPLYALPRYTSSPLSPPPQTTSAQQRLYTRRASTRPGWQRWTLRRGLGPVWLCPTPKLSYKMCKCVHAHCTMTFTHRNVSSTDIFGEFLGSDDDRVAPKRRVNY